MDLIKKQDAQMAVQDHYNKDHGFRSYEDGQRMLNRINALPLVQKTGKWMTPKEYCQHLYETTGERYSPAPTGLESFVYCSQCEKTGWFSHKYCPHCGSRNRGEEE